MNLGKVKTDDPTLGGFLTGTFTRGTFTANGATAVTVSNTSVKDDSLIVVTLKTPGGTVGALPRPVTITPTTGFTIAGTASDTSVYNYSIINQS